MMWLVREWLAWFSPRRWRYSRRHAAHVVRMTEAEVRAGPDFYGSMCLDDERGLPANWAAPSSKIAAHAYSTAWLPAPEVAHSGWWGQMEADLAPEALALDSGPGGCSAFLPGPDPAPAFAPADPRHDGKREGRAFHGLNHADEFGPNAARVLERYEARRRERWCLSWDNETAAA